ncbi:MAG: YcaO-like family protein [Defluviitaleaceae bacterium]|nr:YcaO-like family protein [Defluviitaleaceae bacterium]
MKYELDEIPLINKICSYQYDSERVICSFSSSEIKIFNCDPNVLKEVLVEINGKNTFAEIEKKFNDKYLEKDVRFFLETILEEGIIEKSNHKFQIKKKPNILIIGEGLISEVFTECTRFTLNHFLEKDVIADFDIVILAPSSCTYSDLLDVNKKLYKYQKPFIKINFNGNGITLGPLVIPNKSACLECIISSKVKNINANLPNGQKITINDLKNLKYSYDVPKEFGKSNILYLVDVLYNDLMNFFNGNSSEFLNCEYFFNSYSLHEHKEERLPTTYCEFCNGINKNYLKVGSTFSFKDDVDDNKLKQDIIKYKTGGLRSKTEDETKNLIDVELDKLKSKINIKPNIENPFNDIAPSYLAYFEQMNDETFPYILKKDTAAGKGVTETQAYFSAAFELFEHISRQYTGNIPIISAKYCDVKKFAIDMPHLSKTIMNKKTSFDDFDENSEIDWVAGISLTDNTKKLLPAFLTFMFDVELKGTLFVTSSTGVASGLTLEDAILHGLFEVIEHDAWAIGQSNPYVLPVVDYASSANKKIKEIVSKVKDMGYDIITRDYTNDLSIPVFRTYIVNRNNYSQYAYNGFGCHILPEIALERSITEALQFCDSIFGGKENSLVNKNVLAKSLSNLYNQHFLVNKDILGNCDKVTSITKPIFEFNSSYDVIKKVTDLVKKKIDGDVFYVELTKPNMNIKVVRVIITGDIQRLNYPLLSTSKRIFEFGIRCGYSNKKTTYEELFMGDYQH